MTGLNDNQKKSVEKLMGISQDNELFWDDGMRLPKFIKGKLSVPSKDRPEAVARKFLDDNKGLFDLQEGLDEELEFSYEESDNQGFKHICLHQTLKGLPVFEGSVQVHINPDGEVVAYKDNRISMVDLSTEPKVTGETAIETALRDVYKERTNIKSDAGLLLFRDNDKILHLAWEVELIDSGELGGRFYFIDAHTGQILYKYAQIRGALSRMTYTAKKRAVLPGDLVIQDNQNTSDEVAQSAHDHIATVYEYYKDTFGRDSYDNRGATLVSTVHFKENYNNAYWSDWYGQMVYGDGDGYRWKPLALALDIVGHELTHAVTSRTAKFVYAEEAGALDESFADFFGAMVSNDDPVTDWEMGEGVFTPYRSGDALRDLSDPPKYDQPDHMDNYLHLSPGEQPDPDKNDNGYVHSNSGIPNKVAYLIVEGNTHSGITVEGIGREKAEQIYYFALTKYLSSSTPSRWTFKQARYALLNACRQLYGETGPEYSAVKDAWASVGIGQPAGDLALVQKEEYPDIAIPDNNPSGIQSTINLPEEGVLKGISVSLGISHTYIGDLRVILASPSGESALLHDRTGGSKRDIIKSYNLDSTPGLMTFIGDDINGEWALRVSDNARRDIGILEYWGIELLTQKAEKKRLEEKTSPGMQIPDNNPAGIESIITIDKPGRIVNADISVDVSHTWIGDLKIILLLPSGDEITLHNRTGYSRREINKTYSTKSDEPLQLMIGKKIRGEWKLKVFDLAGKDTGTLNKWGLIVTYSGKQI